MGEGGAEGIRHKMEKMRKMMGLPRLRVPTYAQLWDGTWWAKVICPCILIFIDHLCPEG